MDSQKQRPRIPKLRLARRAPFLFPFALSFRIGHVRKKIVEDRSSIFTSLEISPSHPPITILCTHLDHLDENIRLSQIKYFLKKNDKKPNLIVGDLNCLNFSDYSCEGWKEMMENRRKDSWELPKTEFMDFMRGREERKCTTLQKIDELLAWLEYGDMYRDTLEGKEKRWDYTSRFRTRVDYILLSKRRKGAKVKGMEFCNTIKQGISDHKMFCCELEFLC